MASKSGRPRASKVRVGYIDEDAAMAAIMRRYGGAPPVVAPVAERSREAVQARTFKTAPCSDKVPAPRAGAKARYQGMATPYTPIQVLRQVGVPGPVENKQWIPKTAHVKIPWLALQPRPGKPKPPVEPYKPVPAAYIGMQPWGQVGAGAEPCPVTEADRQGGSARGTYATRTIYTEDNPLLVLKHYFADGLPLCRAKRTPEPTVPFRSELCAACSVRLARMERTKRFSD